MYYRKSDDTYVNPGYHNIVGHRGLSLLLNKQDFDNGSLSASWTEITDHEGYAGTPVTEPKVSKRVYIVWSYQTPIALFDPTDNTLYQIDYRYSVTTSQHQGMLWDLARHCDYVVDCEPAWGGSHGAWRALTHAAFSLAMV